MSQRLLPLLLIGLLLQCSSSDVLKQTEMSNERKISLLDFDKMFPIGARFDSVYAGSVIDSPMIELSNSQVSPARIIEVDGVLVCIVLSSKNGIRYDWIGQLWIEDSTVQSPEGITIGMPFERVSAITKQAIQPRSLVDFVQCNWIRLPSGWIVADVPMIPPGLSLEEASKLPPANSQFHRTDDSVVRRFIRR